MGLLVYSKRGAHNGGIRDLESSTLDLSRDDADMPKAPYIHKACNLRNIE